ncbi:glycosyltransferase, partial [Patescibacteria group bacterium]|nr:glycosyltransferase [Patescibacteria group bacterium]
LLSEDKIRFHLLGSPQQYVEYGKKTGIFTSSYTHDVCFVGNIYLNQVKNNPLSQFDIIKNIAQKVADKKIADFSNHAWDLLLAEIQEIPTKTREIFKLKLDESFFWNAYIYIIWIGVNTYVRMKVLSSIEEVAFYGGFADPYGINELYSFKNINYMNSVDYLVDLPRIFNTTKITVDVTNQLVHNSAPGKFFECFSAGGFMLIDYSKDIIKAFGEKAKLISYKTINELNAKIEYYLSHDRERQEITRFFQNEINTNYTTKKWLSFITSDLKMRIERTGQSERR